MALFALTADTNTVVQVSHVYLQRPVQTSGLVHRAAVGEQILPVLNLVHTAKLMNRRACPDDASNVGSAVR